MSRLAWTLILLAAATVLPAQITTPKKKPAPPVKSPPPAAAASPANATVKPQQFPIEAIKIGGSKSYDQAAIVALTGLRIGEPLEERRIETARDNLLANGAFTNVSFRYDPAPSQKGYVVTFELVELTQLFDYRFDRLEADEAKLRAFLKEREPLFGQRIPGAANVLLRFSGAIAEYLRSQSKPAEVVGRVTTDAGDALVMFSPPGQMPAVATVTFTGNKLMTLTQLQNKIHPVAVGSQFRETRFRELLEIGVRPLYEARGRLRMKFAKIESKPSEAVKGLAVTVEIDEGEAFSFGPVTLVGVPGAEDALVKAAAVPEAEVADMQLVTAAQAKLERLMRASGNMAATTTYDRQLNDADRLCNITFRIVPGPKYTFGKLLFQGLDLHGEHEMRRMWTMKPGAPYNGDYPELFATRIKEDQLFDGLENVRALPVQNDKALTVDVKLVFNERKPKILQ